MRLKLLLSSLLFASSPFAVYAAAATPATSGARRGISLEAGRMGELVEELAGAVGGVGELAKERAQRHVEARRTAAQMRGRA